jgi:hypothetical protein
MNEVPDPGHRLDNPASDPDLRFVRVDDVRQGDQGKWFLKVTPVTSTGSNAGQPREVRIRDAASVFGEYSFGIGSDHTHLRQIPFPTPIDVAARQMQDALQHGFKPTAWIKQKYVLGGPVIFIQEHALLKTNPNDPNPAPAW